MEIVILAAALMIALSLKHREIREAIEDFNDRFRGGPPRPMHPSPVNDACILRRRR